MKMLLVSLLTLATASFAQAAPLSCTSNIGHDLRKPSTFITIDTVQNKTTATVVQSGGMAHYITRARTFEVLVKNVGPEVVNYTNAQEGFDMVVTYQPIGGKILGSVQEIYPNSYRSQFPVVCVMALN